MGKKKEIYKFILLIICSLLLTNGFLSSFVEKVKKMDKKDGTITLIDEKDILEKILSPLSKKLKFLEDLNKSVNSASGELNKVKSLSETLSFSSLAQIREPETRSQITEKFKAILKSSQLLPKERYISDLNKLQSRFSDKSLYQKITTLMEKVYSFKKNFNNINNKLVKFKEKIEKVDSTVKGTIEKAESILKKTRLIPGISKKLLTKCETKFNDIKSKVLAKMKLVTQLKGIIEKAIKGLNRIHGGVIRKLENIPTDAPLAMEQPTKLAIRQVAGDIEEETMNVQSNLRENFLDTTVSKRFPDTVTEGEKDTSVVMKPKVESREEDVILEESLKKGIEYFNEEKIDKAREIFEKEIQKNPNNWYARNYLSKVYIKEKRYDEAIKEINKAIEIFKKMSGIKK